MCNFTLIHVMIIHTIFDSDLIIKRPDWHKDRYILDPVSINGICLRFYPIGKDKIYRMCLSSNQHNNDAHFASYSISFSKTSATGVFNALASIETQNIPKATPRPTRPALLLTSTK